MSESSTALDHKSGDNSVENKSVVEASLNEIFKVFAGLGRITGSCHPAVAQGRAFGEAAEGAGLGGLAGGFLPDVLQLFALGLMAVRAGLGCVTAGIYPGMGLGFLLQNAAGGTFCRLFTIRNTAIGEGMTQGIALGLAAQGAGLGF